MTAESQDRRSGRTRAMLERVLGVLREDDQARVAVVAVHVAHATYSAWLLLTDLGATRDEVARVTFVPASEKDPTSYFVGRIFSRIEVDHAATPDWDPETWAAIRACCRPETP